MRPWSSSAGSLPGSSSYTGYFLSLQWVRKDLGDQGSPCKRADLWHGLGRAVGTVPRRNVLVPGGDLNAAIAPMPGLIGRGLLGCRGGTPDQELLDLIDTHQLCLLNTWGSARASSCATFRNGTVATQIDFLAVRRAAADPYVKQACPIALDLAPSRDGPKHYPVKASIPFAAGWRLSAPARPASSAFSRDALAERLTNDSAVAHAFRAHVRSTVQSAIGHLSPRALNVRLVSACARFFPAKPVACDRPGEAPAVVASIRHMWQTHAELRRPRVGTAMQRIFVGWVRFARFKKAAQAVRNAGKAARRQWLHERIASADEAASRHDLRTVFRIVRQIAPKQRRDTTRIRGSDGCLLDMKQQFDVLLAHFTEAFTRADAFDFESNFAAPDFSAQEVQDVIKDLKMHKAVPKVRKLKSGNTVLLNSRPIFLMFSASVGDRDSGCLRR